MELSAGSATLVGRVRAANEDAFLVADGIVAVADGMGGHLAGEVASADTVETLGAVVGMRAVEELVGAVHLANRRIHDRAAENDELRGMGTTVCVLAQVSDEGSDRLVVLNVGDSRVYHYGSDGLEQLTEDHSLVEVLVREGRLTPEEAAVHPQRNVLTRALGVDALVSVDAWMITPCDGDRFLLCSDGLFNELEDARIVEILKEAADPETAAKLLANRAEDAGGRDNITAVVVDVTGTDQAAASLSGRVRRLPSTKIADLSDLDERRANDTASLPPVVAPLVHDDPAAADANSTALADEPTTDEVAQIPLEAEQSVGPDDLVQVTPRRTWRFWVFPAAVAAIVLVGIAVIVVGVVVRPTATTTTTSSTSTSTTLPTTTSTTPLSTTIPTSLPTAPATGPTSVKPTPTTAVSSAPRPAAPVPPAAGP